MAKAKKTIFFCQQCGYETAKWMGQCPACREWNTFVEEPAEETHAGISTGNRRNTQSVEPMPLSRVEMTDQERFTTGIGELDRVLGGGIVPASLVLVGGDPGIGKSTLLLQVCKIWQMRITVCFISRARNRCSRSKSVQTESVHSQNP